MRKVPEVTIFFWIVKVLTTAVGESTSDYLVHVMNPAIAVLIGAVGFVIAMIWQFSVRRYIALVYWFAVAMVAVFGTMAADVLHIGFGIPYLYSTIFFAIMLCIIFTFWYFTEGTLSIHSIYTRRREQFYWATVCVTFALGTAAGDMAAITLKLGYLAAGIWFGIVIVLIAAAHFVTKVLVGRRRSSVNAVLAFWLAYIFTRPLGASFADWMGKAQAGGGLGWGDGTVTIGLTILIALCVGYLSVTHIDVKEENLVIQ